MVKEFMMPMFFEFTVSEAHFVPTILFFLFLRYKLCIFSILCELSCIGPGHAITKPACSTGEKGEAQEPSPDCRHQEPGWRVVHTAPDVTGSFSASRQLHLCCTDGWKQSVVKRQLLPRAPGSSPQVTVWPGVQTVRLVRAVLHRAGKHHQSRVQTQTLVER